MVIWDRLSVQGDCSVSCFKCQIEQNHLNEVLFVLHLAEIIQIFLPVGVPISCFLCKHNPLPDTYQEKGLCTHIYTHPLEGKVLNVWDKNQNLETKIVSF